jgi:hypothetical protein
MRPSPSIVPPGGDQDIYLVLDDFGDRLGQAWRETDVEHTALETVLADLLDGQYSNPVRVVAFNTAEGWSRDVSRHRQRAAPPLRSLSSEVPETLRDFMERHRQTAEQPTVSGVDPGPAGFDWQE